MSAMPSFTPLAFVAGWRPTTLTERASYQQHFFDLCRQLGYPMPADPDPTGESFTFEASTRRQGGQAGVNVR